MKTTSSHNPHSLVVFRAKLISHLYRQVTPIFNLLSYWVTKLETTHSQYESRLNDSSKNSYTLFFVHFLHYSTFNTSNGELDVLNVRSVCMYKVYTIYIQFLLYCIMWVHNFCTFSPLQYVQHVQWRVRRVERTKCVYVQSLYYLHTISLILHHLGS